MMVSPKEQQLAPFFSGATAKWNHVTKTIYVAQIYFLILI